jgi:hypothetical protein
MESLGGTGLGPGARPARLAVAISFAALVVAGCGGSNPGATHGDADAATIFDGRFDGGEARDVRTDTPVGPDSACGVADGGAKKAPAAACSCDGDCLSGHCVDGVCCNTACKEGCKTCTAVGSVGTCTNLVAGTKPRDQSVCATSAASTCGFDGTCDGAGACRRHVAGTICKAGTCDGDAVVGAFACDGAGRCRPGPTTICAPYSCDANKGACFEGCSQSSQCVAGQQCVAGSCGKKMKGASCSTNSECASGACADKVCCNVACQGGCVSCALPGRMGTCWPIDQGVPDPRGACKDQGAPSCGSTGTCDGFGGCELYAAETQCIPPSCTGTRLDTAGTCDGSGTCRPQKVQPCGPFLCTNGACTQSCKNDGDCEAGHACVNGQCGKKNLGQPCAGGTECLSGQCVEGVCCDGACSGGCRSCALASAMGHCTPLALGAVDTKGVCSDQGATTCGTNGRCDGSGGCQKYKEGTVCAPETCTGNVYTPASTCSATGQCTPPDSLPCAPYTCNGTACFNACTNDNNCISPNVCNGNSCGKKMRGASCSEAKECGSGFCAQGVCCDAACDGTCVSCALGTSRGTCMPVPAGTVDQGGKCADQGGDTCGSNGKCDGAGACQKYALGTGCKDSTCPGGTTNFTPASSCDGTGTCVTPPGSSCFPFQCGAAVCKATCASDADCAAPAVCANGSCGLKGRGQTCAGADECGSGFCAQGVCCDSACNGTCRSCALQSSLGTCSNVPDGGKDPMNRCLDQGASSCATDGTCDGLGSCRLYDAGTPCMPATCPSGSSTWTLTRTCDGQGTCKAATTQPCAPYMCNGLSACKAACTVDADCMAPSICDQQTNQCGNKRRLGQTCNATSDCLTGNYCVDGVCCASSSCGLCQTCSTGTCANVGSGKVEPHGGCAASPPCGNTGNCNGAGACEQASASVACGTASCTGSTYTPLSHCTGTGACATPVTSGCSPYVCGGGVCLVNCNTDGDCVTPFTCQGSGSTRSCALKANGVACAGGAQCISGSCVDGVCCGSSSCPSCQACNVGGSAGACAPLPAGTNAPATFCTDQGPSSCGTNGKCDGAGACQKYPNNTPCSSAICTAGATSLTLAGACNGGTCQMGSQSCSGFLCTGGSACPTTCNADADCAATHYCTGAGGTCQPKIAQGSACTSDHQCGTNHCTDGVCCGAASCASCQACNVGASAGVCAPVAAGTPAPATFCSDQGPSSCGTNGKCDGAGGCQKYPNNTVCSSAICTAGATSLTLAGACNGGTCQMGSQSCNGFLCAGGSACPTTCNADADCAATHYCTGTGGTCQPKIAQGSACTSNHQCGTSHCVDLVCCGSAACGSCQACNVSSNPGTCTPLAAGTPDPKNVCVDNLPGACGTNGKCDGAGGCQKYPNNTPCSAAICTAGATSLTTAGACSGGSCQTGSQSCNGVLCTGGTACPTTCNADGDCAGTHYCTGAGGTCQPKIAQGSACTSNHECGTSHCVDLVCCGSAACGSCQACNVSSNPGTCTPLAAGTPDPKNVCTDNLPGACGTNGKCDGNGGCQKYADATMCSQPSCPAGSSTLTKAGGCSSGSCVTTTQSCGAYACNGTTACRTMCAGDGDCASGYFCTSMPLGTCTAQLALGDACGGDNECASGHCTDGVCCGSASCGPCYACNLGGLNPGTCKPLTAGTPAPASYCSVQSTSTCGRNGNCDGSGGCQKYANGTGCSPAVCTAGATSLTTAGACNGTGTCVTGTQSCNGVLCTGGTSCPTTCDVDGDCASTHYCTGAGGTCQPKGDLGDACGGNNQCKNGQCVDSTCCGSASCAACYACNLGGGTCKPNDGVACAAQSCPATGDGATQYNAATCSSGSCNVTTSSCGGYKCDGATSCKTKCDLDGDCDADHYCTGLGGSCAAKGDVGDACGGNNQCKNGQCVDGVCCGTATCAGCYTCNYDAAHKGSCHVMDAGPSFGFCLAEDPDTCGRTGLCDGAGHCAKWDTTTVCLAASCTPGTSDLTPASKCDGAGTCVPPAVSPVSCDAYSCNASGTGCNTDCSSDADCSTGNSCQGMTCGPS